MTIEPCGDEHELAAGLVYDEHGRWMLFGEETTSPVTVLAVLLLGTMSSEIAEA